MLLFAHEDVELAAGFGDYLSDVAEADFLGGGFVGLDAEVGDEVWVEAASGAEFAEVVFEAGE